MPVARVTGSARHHALRVCRFPKWRECLAPAGRAELGSARLWVTRPPPRETTRPASLRAQSGSIHAAVVHVATAATLKSGVRADSCEKSRYV